MTYLTAAAKVFGDSDFHYVGQWYGERSAVLEFAATIDGRYVNGVDMIAWNDARPDRVVQGDAATVQGSAGVIRKIAESVALPVRLLLIADTHVPKRARDLPSTGMG